jgi:hypothetical protein
VREYTEIVNVNLSLWRIFESSLNSIEDSHEQACHHDCLNRFVGIVELNFSMPRGITQHAVGTAKKHHRALGLTAVDSWVCQRTRFPERLLHQITPNHSLWKIAEFTYANLDRAHCCQDGVFVLAQ